MYFCIKNINFTLTIKIKLCQYMYILVHITYTYNLPSLRLLIGFYHNQINHK